MTRYRATAEGNIPFTTEEELEFEAEARAAAPVISAAGVLQSLDSGEITAFVDFLQTQGVINQTKANKLKGK